MLTLILKANNSCNLRCSYCSVGDKSSAEMMTEAEMTKALLWFAGYARERRESQATVIFHGGEPLLIPVRQYRNCIEELLSRNTDLKITFNIQTNGTIMNDEILAFLRDYDVKPGVSIDGPESVHDSQRRDILGRSSYSRIMANIMTLKTNGIRPSALMVLTSRSLSHDLEFLRDFAELDLPLKINPLYSAGEAVNHSELFLKSGEYAEYLIRVFEYIIDKEIDITLMPIEYLLRAVITRSTPKGCVFSGKCSESFICVSYDGNIYPCGRYSDDRINALGNIYSGGITESGQGILRSLRDARTTNLRSECFDCKYKSMCNGGCNAMNGLMCRDFIKFMDYLYGAGMNKYKSYLMNRREFLLGRLKNAV